MIERRVGRLLDQKQASGLTRGLPSPHTVFGPLSIFNLKGKNRVEHHVRKQWTHTIRQSSRTKHNAAETPDVPRADGGTFRQRVWRCG